MRIQLPACLALLCASACLTTLEAAETDTTGRLVVTLEKAGSQYSILYSAAVPGSAPAVHPASEDSYRLLDSEDSLLASGMLYIPRNVYHDKSDDSGRLLGFRRKAEDPVTISIPYVESARFLELLDKSGQILLREELDPEIISAPHAAITVPASDSILGDYLNSLAARDRPPTSSYPTGITAGPATVAVTGSVSVAGVSNLGLLYTDIAFHNRSDGTFVNRTIADSHGSFTIQLNRGSYLVKGTCWYYDPAFNGQAVPLYPSPLTIADYTTGAGTPPNLKLEWKLNYLFIGKVKAACGQALEANVFVVEKKYTGSTFQTAIAANVNTRADGSFAVRMPAKSFAFAVVPRCQDLAGEILTVKRVKKKTKIQNFVCPDAGKTAGSALKQIHGTVNTKGKLNLIFLAEAYTGKNEKFTDGNGNGIWDGDLLLDDNGNGKLDKGEYYFDRNNNGVYDKPEKFKDKNGDGICNRYERAQFECDCAVGAAALLNYLPFSKQAKRINIFSYWVSSKHGTQSFTGLAKPMVMNTAFRSYCGGKGGMQMGGVSSILVHAAAGYALPDYTVPIVMVHDPYNAMRSNAMFGYGRVLQSAQDFRGGAVLTHELGHSIGNLADEYVYTAGKTYTGAEPASANVTIETNPAKVKWGTLIKGNPPVPTPFGYDGYGIFEGGAYGSFGLYRPTATSLMRNTNYPFFKVNEAHLKKILKTFKK